MLPTKNHGNRRDQEKMSSVASMIGTSFPVRPTLRELARFVAILVAATSTAVEADTIVYKNDFNLYPGTPFAEWSSSRITYVGKFTPPGRGTRNAPVVTNSESPNRRRRFLGEFGGPRIDPTARTRVRQAVRLTLDRLPPHEQVTVSFDLLILKSWDGSSPGYGPDRWRLSVAGGRTLLDTTFSNNPMLNADKSFQDYPRPQSRHQEGQWR
jgi:hypothetical protein